MKWKKPILYVGMSIAMITLTGCVLLNSPKNAYVGALKEVENASSYMKVTELEVGFQDKESKELSTLQMLLSNSDITLTSLTDHSSGKSDIRLQLDGEDAQFPIDTTIHMVLDETKQQLFVDGDSLADGTGEGEADEPWVSVDLKAGEQPVWSSLLELAPSTLLGVLPEEKFIRSDVTPSEKSKQMVDKVSVTLQRDELNELLTNAAKEQEEVALFLQSYAIDSVELTAYFDRKGKFIQESMRVSMQIQADSNSSSMAVEMDTYYSNWDDPTTILFDPSKEKVVPLSEWTTKKPSEPTL